MIAGVVAFAILIVLLMVINGVGTIGGQDAKTVITDAIRSISPSGDTSTPEFYLGGSGGINGVTADDLSKTGLDPQSIQFSLGKYASSDSGLTLTSDPSGVRYNGSTKLKAKARVICKQTGEKLSTYLSSNVSDAGDITVCGEEYQPCCAVILQRPTS
jgi:hypothetical protein